MEARKSYKQQNHEDPWLAFVRSPPLSVLLRSSNGCRRDYPAPTQPERPCPQNSDYCEKVTVAWVISSSPKWNPSQLKRFKLFIRPNRARTKNLKSKKYEMCFHENRITLAARGQTWSTWDCSQLPAPLPKSDHRPLLTTLQYFCSLRIFLRRCQLVLLVLNSYVIGGVLKHIVLLGKLESCRRWDFSGRWLVQPYLIYIMEDPWFVFDAKKPF